MKLIDIIKHMKTYTEHILVINSRSHQRQQFQVQKYEQPKATRRKQLRKVQYSLVTN